MLDVQKCTIRMFFLKTSTTLTFKKTFLGLLFNFLLGKGFCISLLCYFSSRG